MSGPNTVTVKNISAKTEDKEIRDFFAFCGKIEDLQVATEGDTKTATVVFQKETASKTALLLNNTQLGSSHISVTSSSQSLSDDATQEKSSDERDSDELTQEEKPRSRILAEYLAHGYVVGDVALQSAIELDSKHGVSSRFLGTLNSLDQKYHATDRAKTADQSYGITSRANSLLTGLGSYFEKAANTPTGKRVVDFYTQSSRQVQDIHTEARRLANLKTEEAGGSAYKASGFEKVFGAEKPKEASGGADAPGTSTTPTAIPGTIPSAGAPVTTEQPKTQPVEPAPKS